VNDQAKQAAEEAARRAREADLVSFRIAELRDNPVQGHFDAERLKAVHARLFQDLPEHRPGVMREDTTNWTKHRRLEERPGGYDVPYVSRDVEGRLTRALERFGGAEAIKGLTPEAAATRLARFYADLDYAPRLL
jgi:fido (protein-threonine AMPylation protein)